MEQLRVNTLLDDDTLASLHFLRKELGGSSVAETVKYSLVVAARLLQEKKSHEGGKMKALLDSDFIGSGEGSEDLSVNYKEYLYQGLKEYSRLATSILRG